MSIMPLQTSRGSLIGPKYRLQFRMNHVGNHRSAGTLGPMRALVLHPADGWQDQCWVRPVRGDMYELSLPIPRAGDLFLFFARPGPETVRPQPHRLSVRKSRERTVATGRAAGAARVSPHC